jgi:hypothetical protein
MAHKKFFGRKIKWQAKKHGRSMGYLVWSMGYLEKNDNNNLTKKREKKNGLEKTIIIII